MRGPGRPLGSLNQTTVQWASYLSDTYGSPLEIAARTGAMTVAAIAAEVGCDPATAAKLRLRSWEFTAKYTHPEMPRAIEVDAVVDEPFDQLSRFFPPAFAATLLAAQADAEDNASGDPLASQPPET
jgi:hypothetical protein